MSPELRTTKGSGGRPRHSLRPYRTPHPYPRLFLTRNGPSRPDPPPRRRPCPGSRPGRPRPASPGLTMGPLIEPVSSVATPCLSILSPTKPRPKIRRPRSLRAPTAVVGRPAAHAPTPRRRIRSLPRSARPPPPQRRGATEPWRRQASSLANNPGRNPAGEHRRAQHRLGPTSGGAMESPNPWGSDPRRETTPSPSLAGRRTPLRPKEVLIGHSNLKLYDPAT